MRILDKYILKTIFKGYLCILFVFIGLFLIIDLFSALGDILKAKPPLGVILSYYLYMIPWIFKWVSPYSLLISTLYTFGELNKSNEILSMRASGISIARIAFPVLFLATFISFGALTLQEKVTITAQGKSEKIKKQYINKELYRAGEEKNISFLSSDMIFFAGKFFPKKGLLENVFIFKEDKAKRISHKIRCESMAYKNGIWQGKRVLEYALDKDGNILGTPKHWDKKVIDLKESPAELILKKSEFSSLSVLKKEINRLKDVEAYDKLSRLTIDYQHRIAEPFSHLFLVMGILPFALQIKKRKVTLSALGIGFIFGLAYYTAVSLCLALGKAGFLLAVIAPWVTPIFFMSVGITGMLLVR